MVGEVITIGRATHIYALCDEHGTVRYVGKTVRTPQLRFAQHRRDAGRRELPVCRWLRKHPDATVKLIETVPPTSDWIARERHWIESFDNLLNLTAGGEGLPGHKFNTEHRRKIAEAIKTGAEFSCETCGTGFWRKLNEIAKGNNRFCSRACYAASNAGVSKPVSDVFTRRGVVAAAALRRAQAHCKRGHLLSGDNMFRTSGGSRGCKECRKIHKLTHRRKSRG